MADKLKTDFVEFAEEVYDRDLDARVNAELLSASKSAVVAELQAMGAEPDSVDLSAFLHLIRRQSGAGCWGYSTVAVWDIMNEMACPFSPNLSMRLWMMLHRRRELWDKQKGIYTPDGRFHAMTNPEYGFLQSFGNVTEGTERTLHNYPSEWPDGGWSEEGINEASNYRLASHPKPIPVSSVSFIAALAAGKPFRLLIEGKDASGKGWGHWIAVVGYDKLAKTFKYVNSAGDLWKNGGFDTYTFAEVDSGQAGAIKIAKAETFDIHVPRPVPAARISVKHTNRSNVVLWMSVEDSPHPPSQIWPQGWHENSANLRFTVRLPKELIWPPTQGSRVLLDVFDTGEYGISGGTLTEFTAAFGGHVISSPDVPAPINVGEHRRFALC
jgi:hypothetical protein